MVRTVLVLKNFVQSIIMASISDEEENYLRMSMLLTGISPRAVRAQFDRIFPPSDLPSKVRTNFNDLCDLKKKKVINQVQWNLLFPSNGTPDSKTFDISLMFCLIRNFSYSPQPLYGYDHPPQPWNINIEDDLARIKYYRNHVSHLTDGKIDSSYFNTAWNDITEAIKRLSDPNLHQECLDLRFKTLDRSNHEIMLEVKKLQTEVQTLQVQYQDPVPWNIRGQITEKLNSWKEGDKEFVETRAAQHILKCLKSNNCVTVTGSSGMGKTVTVRHVALKMKGEGYNIIPITEPGEIITCYHPNQKTLHVVDDLCGTNSLNINDLERWKKFIEDLNKQCEKKLTKIIVTCRLQVYQDEKFDTLSFFKSCECNLLSDDLSLLQTEKKYIAELYLKSEAAKIVDWYDLYDCFPLLCKWYRDNTGFNIEKFFKSPYSVYAGEIDKLRTESELYKYCALALCVMFDNCLKEDWLTEEEVDRDVQTIIENTCKGCKLDKGTSGLKLRDELDSLVNSFIKKQNGIYSTIHDKLFDFLTYYFGNKMIRLLIKNVKSRFICERFLFGRLEESDEFLITVPLQYQDMYIQRMFDDWSKGQVIHTFNNRNMTSMTFKATFKQYLNSLPISQQEKFVHKCDVTSKDNVLTRCCFIGYIDMIYLCLDYGLDVNYCGYSGMSSLYAACRSGQVEIVKIVLNNKPDINKCSIFGMSPLYIACQHGYAKIVKILLNNKADLNKCDKLGISPLCIASQQGHAKIVKILLRSKADLNKCDQLGISPLIIACEQGHVEVVKILLNSKADINGCQNNGASPLYNACRQGHVDVLKLLLSNNADVYRCRNDESSPLHIPCQMGNAQIVKILLNSKADTNKCDKFGVSPLFIACQDGHVEIVKILLNSKADINKCTNEEASPLYIACHNGHVEIVTILLNSKADINKCMNVGASPLYIACKCGHVEIVKVLINSKADINKCDKLGTSPLYNACQKGHVEIVKILMNSKADINKSRNEEVSPLYIACQNGHVEIVKMLMNSKPDINKCNNYGGSPMFIACQEGHVEIVKILMNSKADINKCTHNGASPLVVACHCKHIEIVKLLLDSHELEMINDRLFFMNNHIFKRYKYK